MNSQRVVVTGTGSISPLGMTGDQMWEGLCEGRSGIGEIKSFDASGFTCRIAGEVPEFKINKFVPKTSRKAIKLMSRDIELSIVAALDAISNSGLKTKGINPGDVSVDPKRMGINLGAGLISCDLVEISPAVAASKTDGNFDIKKWGEQGLGLVTPVWLLKYLPNMLPCHVGIIHDIQGPSNTITCAESSALLAVGEAAQIIARGSADVMVTGGAEAKVNPLVLIRQCLIGRAVSDKNIEGEKACRPFDADAGGSVFGEAAGILVLESIEHAKGRDAEILAEVVGIGQSNSINSEIYKLESDGKGVGIAIEKALADAEICAEQLDLIIPHGTGIAEDDLAEAKGIVSALGDVGKVIPVLPTKSMLSNTGAAGGALDLITAVKAINSGVIPAAKNCESRASGCELNINKEKIKKDISYVLCCSYSYGGQTAAIVLKKYEN